MNKATLEFNLSHDTGDRDAFLRACRADEAWATLWDIDHGIRNLLKHGDDKQLTSDALIDYLEGVRTRIHEGGMMDIYT